MNNQKLIGPFKQIISLENLALKGPLSDDELVIYENAGVLVSHGKIEEIIPWKEAAHFDGTIEYADEGEVLIPAFVDSHTHICFGGSRAQDYSLRIGGKTYLEIAKSGGGIWSSVEATRACSQEELTALCIQRLDKQLQQGITTCEIKSGYGLSIEEELKMLRAIKEASKSHEVDIVPTCLAAHLCPKDFDGNNEEYLEEILDELLPIVLEECLSKRVDIFIEEGAFNVEEAKEYLQQAKHLGFNITIHGDQFSTGGSQLAIDLKASSVDHLEASQQNEIDALSHSNTIATVLPGASLGLGCQFAPARRLLDANISVAIASDWNPGSAPMGNLLVQAAVLSASEKLSNAETFAGLTFRAAKALGLNDRGVISNGMKADFIAFPCEDYREILYHQGQMSPIQVWVNGDKKL